MPTRRTAKARQLYDLDLGVRYRLALNQNQNQMVLRAGWITTTENYWSGIDDTGTYLFQGSLYRQGIDELRFLMVKSGRANAARPFCLSFFAARRHPLPRNQRICKFEVGRAEVLKGAPS